jgi:hypothetical protein
MKLQFRMARSANADNAFVPEKLTITLENKVKSEKTGAARFVQNVSKN